MVTTAAEVSGTREAEAARIEREAAEVSGIPGTRGLSVMTREAAEVWE
jgi:hypothetical protein